MWQEFGHGFNLTRACILAMDLDEMDRHIEWADQRRKDILAAQRRAQQEAKARAKGGR